MYEALVVNAPTTRLVPKWALQKALHWFGVSSWQTCRDGQPAPSLELKWIRACSQISTWQLNPAPHGFSNLPSFIYPWYIARKGAKQNTQPLIGRLDLLLVSVFRSGLVVSQGKGA